MGTGREVATEVARTGIGAVVNASLWVVMFAMATVFGALVGGSYLVYVGVFALASGEETAWGLLMIAIGVTCFGVFVLASRLAFGRWPK